MAVCPQGHQSATADFCDVCGAPIDPSAQPASAASAAPPAPAAVPAPAGAPPSGLTLPPPAGAPAPAAAAGPGSCPNCGAPHPPDALFCEDCGYDFATGQLPPPPAQIDPVSGVISAPAAPPTPPPSLVGVEWVAEVWVDSDWFAFQQAEGACPTSGLPTVVALIGTTALIGRVSNSRNLHPEIDCSADGAISHSHAELALVNERWSVKDLGSTNGTYVGRPDGTFPSDPLPPRQPHELADDERVYLGAWTRIVVRKATGAERAGTAA